MSVAFPEGMISVTTANGDIVILRICDLCGAAIVEGDHTDLAFHKRWHRLAGSPAPATGSTRRPAAFTAGEPGLSGWLAHLKGRPPVAATAVNAIS